MRRYLVTAALVAAVTTIMVPYKAAFASPKTDSLVTTGSPPSPFPQNKQNEPALAIDPLNPAVMVAGANEEIDLQPCSGSSCPFTPGVGTSGMYFSFDGGNTWTQPTYTGWSARTGTAAVGPIGTLPWYYEAGLVSDGDPAVAFGPRPGPNGFSWSNGARLYYGSLASNFSTDRTDTTFKGFEAIAVSRADDLAAAASGTKSAWMPPVVVTTKTSAATFSDKDGVWADNTATSPFFGNVYACWTDFRSKTSLPAAAQPMELSRSTDGGTTWSSPVQLTPATPGSKTIKFTAAGGRQGCAIRTDSHGAVYVFWEGTDNKQPVQVMTRSFDGGKTFEKPRSVSNVSDVGKTDPVTGDSTFDGLAGARTDSFPSVDLANGSPSGAGATNEIALAWSDASAGLNHEQALLQYSTDGGNSWSTPTNIAESGDRPDFPAVALSPDGKNMYLDYMAFLQDWQETTTSPRLMQGVIRTAPVGSSGAPGAWVTLHRGATGDARGSSQNGLTGEFLGDYDSIVAANSTAVVGVWNDSRNATDCPAVDAYRQSLATSNPLPAPAPGTDCPAEFGNTDIFSAP